jgi:uncharacterized protein (TIGR00290 family)
MAAKKVYVSWSTGKDSAWLVHILRQRPEFEIAGLVTTLNESADRVAIHGVKRELLEAQARAMGLSLLPVRLPTDCPNAEYERRMSEVIEQAHRDGVEGFAFGDLYLEEIRDYRMRLFSGSGIEPLFPIWRETRNTLDLAKEMIEAGLKAILTCVDTEQLDEDFVGREFDHSLLNDLPPHVDPCGEGGEFHTFCYAGPHQPTGELPIRKGRHHRAGRFAFQELTIDQAMDQIGLPRK